MKLLVLLTICALAVASDDYAKKTVKSYSKTYSYYGKYPGNCGNDGLYFRDDVSFIFCSNGNSYVQPCAPGTKNSPYERYDRQAKYDYRDFCDVNLVDSGYGAERYAPKVDYAPKADYQKDSYQKQEYTTYNYEPQGYGYGGNDYAYGTRNAGYRSRGYGFRPYINSNVYG